MYCKPGAFRSWRDVRKPAAWIAVLLALEIIIIYGAVLLIGIAIRGLLS